MPDTAQFVQVAAELDDTPPALMSFSTQKVSSLALPSPLHLDFRVRNTIFKIVCFDKKVTVSVSIIQAL